jgi:hypothetical protein
MTSLKEQSGIVPASTESAHALAALRRASIVARRRALENAGGVYIWRDGEMVWETEPERIFPEGVEVKVWESGRVLVNDLLDPYTNEYLKDPRLERYK